MSERDNVALIDLRRLDEKVDCLLDEMRDVTVRLTGVEESQAGVHRRLDRLEMRVERVERRLDLVYASSWSMKCVKRPEKQT